MQRILKKYKTQIIIFLLLLAGFVVRLFFVSRWISVSGDLLAIAEWGERFWELGPANFYFARSWYYAQPNYPPLVSLVFAGTYWLYNHKYVVAAMHNLIKIPPAIGVTYFYDYGYYLLLKFPAILADLGLGYMIYNLVLGFTKNKKKSLLAMAFFLFNPAIIFLSSVWGQTDSTAALFGLLAFVLLAKKKFHWSLPLLFISFYIKPTWGIFVPLYVYMTWLIKPKVIEYFLGTAFSTLVIFFSALPFAGINVAGFTLWLLTYRIVPTIFVVSRASVSAFNFHTIFGVVDKTLGTDLLLGFPLQYWGLSMFVMANIAAISYIKQKQSELLWRGFFGLFLIGSTAFFFQVNMLERYFLASLAPLVIVMFTKPEALKWGLLINAVFFINLLWAFFRRSVDQVSNIFSAHNFLLIRGLSLTTVIAWLILVRKSFVSGISRVVTK